MIVRADRLASFPEMGRIVPEFKRPDLREVVCRSYRIIHRLHGDRQEVQIVRFWHGARGFPQVSAGD
ncbi:MAG: type II toxin-antitoxin system RelE/ParE family toxin [Verrucomicrobia bacterium]|nr:type II toxin-antitoxin system RelE/ParE family toxin [Verrucomicrobiota bacterium]